MSTTTYSTHSVPITWSTSSGAGITSAAGRRGDEGGEDSS